MLPQHPLYLIVDKPHLQVGLHLTGPQVRKAQELGAKGVGALLCCTQRSPQLAPGCYNPRVAFHLATVRACRCAQGLRTRLLMCLL